MSQAQQQEPKYTYDVYVYVGPIDKFKGYHSISPVDWTVISAGHDVECAWAWRTDYLRHGIPALIDRWRAP